MAIDHGDTHRLTAEQVAEFDEKGVCFIHSVFSESEISSLRSELPRLLARSGDGVVREPDAEDTVRIVYGCHVFSEQFRLLSQHPRLLRPVQQLLREERVYIHQTRLNPKQPFGGGTWDWHQDFGTWNLVDGMAEPRAIMAAVFLEDCDATNAPLMIVPRSQSHGLIDNASRDTEVGYRLPERVDVSPLFLQPFDKAICSSGRAGTSFERSTSKHSPVWLQTHLYHLRKRNLFVAQLQSYIMFLYTI